MSLPSHANASSPSSQRPQGLLPTPTSASIPSSSGPSYSPSLQPLWHAAANRSDLGAVITNARNQANLRYQSRDNNPSSPPRHATVPTMGMQPTTPPAQVTSTRPSTPSAPSRFSMKRPGCHSSEDTMNLDDVCQWHQSKRRRTTARMSTKVPIDSTSTHSSSSLHSCPAQCTNTRSTTDMESTSTTSTSTLQHPTSSTCASTDPTIKQPILNTSSTIQPNKHSLLLEQHELPKFFKWQRRKDDNPR